jgi:hypothetical protein
MKNWDNKPPIECRGLEFNTFYVKQIPLNELVHFEFLILAPLRTLISSLYSPMPSFRNLKKLFLTVSAYEPYETSTTSGINLPCLEELDMILEFRHR